MYKKKSLGQHFLHTPSYISAIADALSISKGELVIEIGPGDGALTAALLERGARVIAIEKDTRLISLLREKFMDTSLEVVEGDALEYTVPAEPYKLIGNIPYYITGALFRRFLTLSHQPTSLVFLVQKEVAERIARSKKESILSLSIKAYGTPVYIKTVPAGAFSPPPQVDSAIIYIKSISRSNFASPQHEARFFELVKRGFAQKRKLLRNNLGPEGASLLTKTGISLQVRAEDTSLEDWLEVSNPI